MEEETNNNPNEQRNILFDYWDKIPAKEFIDIPKSVTDSHPGRMAILGILRDGILDKKRERIRHALNAKEIRDKLEERGIDVSVNTLYFHLNVLEEHGLIYPVASILEGRHRVAYYGRTARYIFSQDPENRLKNYETLFGELCTFLKIIGQSPECDPELLTAEYLKMKEEREERMAEWLVDHEDVIVSNDLSITLLFDALKLLDVVSSGHSNTVEEISKRMQFDPDLVG